MSKLGSARPCRVAAIQMTSSDDKQQNLATVEQLVKEAAVQHQAGLILLPENFSLFDGSASFELGQEQATENGDVRHFIASLAAKWKVWIVAGSIPCSARPDGSNIEDRVRSVCWVYDDRGQQIARYDKIHLFDVDVEDDHGAYRESSQFEAGTDLEVVNSPFGTLGLSICYDLRFPELYTALNNMGAHIITVPAAFTYKTGEAHWDVLLRARAIENQCYVIAANQTGEHSKGRETWGHSMIIDPWGCVLAELEKEQGVISADIDISSLLTLRSAMPISTHRKL